MATHKRLQTVHPPAGILVGALIAKRAVRATLTVFDTPAFQNNARFVPTTEEFAVQAFFAQLVVKAFNVPVLPRAPRLDCMNVLIAWAFSQSCMQ
jgi:hypothetical protein